MRKNKIGIPRGLLYFKYGLFWKVFFEEIGFEVIISPETNKKILEKGASFAVDESCLSVKIFLGHVDDLRGKVDYIFIPHIVSLHRKEVLCTKFWGIYDIAKNTFKGIRLIDCSIDVTNFKFPFFSYFFLGIRLSKNPFKTLRAYFVAKKKEKKDLKERERKQWEDIKNFDKKDPTILIVSHPYTTHDAVLGKPIISYLKQLGVNIVYSDIFYNKSIKKLSKRISKDLYWTYNKELLGGIEYYKKYADGIIFLMTFPCGPDAFVVNLCQNKLNIPILVLVIDELQGEAGLKTRLESFVDILRIKITRKNERTKEN